MLTSDNLEKVCNFVFRVFHDDPYLHKRCLVVYRIVIFDNQSEMRIAKEKYLGTHTSVLSDQVRQEKVMKGRWNKFIDSALRRTQIMLQPILFASSMTYYISSMTYIIS